MTITEAILDFEMQAEDKYNGEKCEHYAQIANWLKEVRTQEYQR